LLTCKPTILVLDEDPLALELYSRELCTEYSVLTSAHVVESLVLLENHHPDVLVIEPSTENNAGWDVLKAIAILKNPPNVILCTTQDDRPEASYPGIDRFLIKPVLPVALHALINQIVAKRLHYLNQRLDQD
jgi:response regulator RpfG family c-di-GMP phosphodiesterase